MTSPARIVAPRSRLRVGLGAAVVLVLVAVGIAVLAAALGGGGATRVVGVTSDPSGSDGSEDTGVDPIEPHATGPPIFVHLLGAVARPGLYELRDGDRGVDAIAAAGGFASDADQAQLNLARRLVDGEQIYVPVVGESPPPTATGDPSSGAGTSGGLVNLNTADAAELDTLPGVGPATAQRILEWREANGRFTAVEDLMSVSGIGDKTFADLADLVTV